MTLKNGGQRKMRGRQRQKIRAVVWQLVAFKEAVPPTPPPHSAGRGVEGGGADILFFSFCAELLYQPDLTGMVRSSDSSFLSMQEHLSVFITVLICFPLT